MAPAALGDWRVVEATESCRWFRVRFTSRFSFTSLAAMASIRLWRLLTIIGAALLAACASHHPPAGAPSARVMRASSTDSLAAAIRRRVADVPGAVAGIYYRAVDAPADSVAIAAGSSFHAASTMKIAVMIQVFRDVEDGRLALGQSIVLRNQFASIVDGSPYVLDPKDDSDSGMYDLVGHSVTVRDLMLRMIQRSSNLATNTVIGLVGAARADSTAHALGASHIRVLRGVEDGKAFERGLNNTATARDLGALLLAIQQDRAAAPAGCAAMRQALLGQEFNTEIPAGLPAGTQVAHKTGQITGVLHDAAIVYPASAPPYVLVVLTSGMPDERVARAMIADISRMVYEHFIGESR
jgi:beta-lactamase class A